MSANRIAVVIIASTFFLPSARYALYQQYKIHGMYIAAKIFWCPSTISSKLTVPNDIPSDATSAPSGPIFSFRAKCSMPSAPSAEDTTIESRNPVGVPNINSSKKSGDNAGNSGSPSAEVPPQVYGFQSGS